MLYVQLDTNWPDHPKIIRAGIDGMGLHAAVLCFAKRLENDGWVDRSLLYRMGADDYLIDRLCELDLLEADGDAVRPDGWLDRNLSQGAIAAIRASKAEAGRKGNHDRWQHPFPFDECPKCHPTPMSSQGAIASESQGVAPDPIPTKSESTPVVTSAIAAAIDSEPPTVRRIPEEIVEHGLSAVAALKSRRVEAS